MINHVSIGVRDVARSKKFYDAALKPLGYKLLSDGETSLGYGDEAVALWVQKSGQPGACRTWRRACISASTRRRGNPSPSSTRRRSARAARTMARPGCAPTMATIITRRLSIDPDGYRLEAYCDKAG